MLTEAVSVLQAAVESTVADWNAATARVAQAEERLEREREDVRSAAGRVLDLQAALRILDHSDVHLAALKPREETQCPPTT